MIPSEHESRLRNLVHVFLEENKKLNLSAFRTEESCWIGNVLDSIAGIDLLQEYIIPNTRYSILDLGTGGGFPLLPLAICLPDVSFTGVDATQKKVDAITRMLEAMDIPNVEMICGRAEELGRDPEHREQYDCVLARALAPLNVLIEYTAPFVKPGGHIIAWKSMNIDKEMEESLLARAELSAHLNKTHAYELPEDWGKRQLIVFDKTSKTSDKYPRETGIPKKNPLL